jgi:hypothetical protein
MGKGRRGDIQFQQISFGTFPAVEDSLDVGGSPADEECDHVLW